MLRTRILPSIVSVLVACSATAQENRAWKFTFGAAAPTGPGVTHVRPDAVYGKDPGYGFDLGARPTAGGEFVTSDKPFFFSVAAPEGNYLVTVTFGGPEASDTTVKAESRRLMLQSVRAPAGKTETRSFTINVRRPELPGGARVRLKAREGPYLHWDDKLTLEFSGPRPVVRSIEVAPAPAETITVYLAGDSTVTDQANEPYNSWGQMLPRFFKSTVAVANHAESGESFKSFDGARRIDKILSTIRPGDYLFVQFGHNDQKDKAPGAGAFTTYAEALRRYVALARERKAIPVLITPVSRRSFGPEGKIVNNLGDFPDSVRRVSREENVALIDLNAMSHPFYEAMGPDKSRLAFAPGDNTHHNNYGSYELARCVVEGIRKARLDLAKHLADDAGSFDPAHPDPMDQFDVPASPAAPSVKPEGN
jgi:lysophospholipase L1-like esterase